MGQRFTATRLPQGLVQLALVLVCLPALEAGADRAHDLLRAAVNADGSVAYSGRCEINLRTGRGPSGHQVQMIVRGSRNRERIEVIAPAEQAGKLIVSNGSTQWEFRPRHKVVLERQLPPLSEVKWRKLDTLKLVSRTLHAAYQGVATVAGRKCHVIAVSPPDGRRVRKRMWIDTGTMVELKWERYDSSGEVTVSWAMSDVDFTPAAAADAFAFVAPPGVAVKRLPLMLRLPLAQAERKIGFRAVVPDYRSAGFVFLGSRVGVAELAPRRSLWMHFTDGVDTFTVVQAPAVKRGRDIGAGAFHWGAKGFSFLLVGPLQKDEMAKVKESTLN